jgi:hypothetical protein
LGAWEYFGNNAYRLRHLSAEAVEVCVGRAGVLGWDYSTTAVIPTEVWNEITHHASTGPVTQASHITLTSRVIKKHCGGKMAFAPDTPVLIGGAAAHYTVATRILVTQARERDPELGPDGLPAYASCWTRLVAEPVRRSRAWVSVRGIALVLLFVFTSAVVYIAVQLAIGIQGRVDDAVHGGALGATQPGHHESVALVVFATLAVGICIFLGCVPAKPDSMASARAAFRNSIIRGEPLAFEAFAELPPVNISTRESKLESIDTTYPVGIISEGASLTRRERGGEPKHHYVSAVGAVFTGFFWRSYSNSAVNVEVALAKRAVPQLDIESGAHARLIQYWHAFLADQPHLQHWAIRPADVMTESETEKFFESWYAQLTPLQRNRIVMARREYPVQLLDAVEGSTPFVKNELSQLVYAGGEIVAKAPRIIVPSPAENQIDDKTYIALAYANLVKKKIEEDGGHGRVAWMHGEISRPAGQWLEEQWPYFDVPLLLEGDCVTLDAHVNGLLYEEEVLEMRKLDPGYMANACPPSVPWEFWDVTFKFAGPDGEVRCKATICRRSGEHGTTPLNNRQVMRAMTVTFHASGCANFSIMINGDDFTAIVERSQFPGVDEVCRKAKSFGFPIKLREVPDLYDLDFCQRWPAPFLDQDGRRRLVFIPKAGRQLARSGWNANHDVVNMQGVGKGMLADAGFGYVTRRLGKLYAEKGSHKGYTPVSMQFWDKVDAVFTPTDETMAWFCLRYGVDDGQVARMEAALDRVQQIPAVLSGALFRPLFDRDL